MSEIEKEQHYVDELFTRLDDEAARARERLAQVQAEVDPANPDNVEALIRRETEYHQLEAKLDRLTIAEIGLVFGRIDIEADNPENPVAERVDRRYIGRMGLDDRRDNYRTLLLDWRTPMARPYYLATIAQPEGVITRRTIRTSGRTVTNIHDEVLQGDSTVSSGDVASESALQYAMNAPRTGHMRSIVETIQREQDAIIRDDHRGVMVVGGGPGTGKTAVALHRAAYLLYTHRDTLARTGVLIIGPNRTFLDYISRVLPELGETGVVLSTIADLYPGVSPTRVDNLLSREVKGSAEMVHILAEAVHAYQVVPEPTSVQVDGIELTIDPMQVRASRTRARRSRKPHNQARGIFREHYLDQLATQMATLIGTDPLGGGNLLSQADVDQLHDDLADDPAVTDLLNSFWPVLDPTKVLADLLDSPERIATAAAGYDDDTLTALHTGTEFSTSDTALLDELATLIGPLPHTKETTEWDQELLAAEEALDTLSSSDSTDNDDDQFEAEILSAADVIDARTLARRQEESDHRTTAQRARADAQWAYGHIIIDEAQELTPMEWRMVMRRSPARWLTVVGDPAQTSSPAGVDDWQDTLAEVGITRFRHHQLSVNYRTPVEIMDVAHRVLHQIDPTAPEAVSVRSVPGSVRYLEPGADLPEFDGLTAIITAENVDEHKGLEYDNVVIINPQEIIDASPQGYQNLYVAITRATQTLTIIGRLIDEA